MGGNSGSQYSTSEDVSDSSEEWKPSINGNNAFRNQTVKMILPVQKNGGRESAESKPDLQIEDNPVINLSSQILSEEQISVLSKGLGFAPFKNFNMFSTLLDINRFAKRRTLKHNF